MCLQETYPEFAALSMSLKRQSLPTIGQFGSGSKAVIRFSRVPLIGNDRATETNVKEKIEKSILTEKYLTDFVFEQCRSI